MMKLEEYDRVKIKATGITGIIVDVPRREQDRCYLVESDERGVPGGHGPEGEFKVFSCFPEELEKI